MTTGDTNNNPLYEIFGPLTEMTEKEEKAREYGAKLAEKFMNEIPKSRVGHNRLDFFIGPSALAGFFDRIADEVGDDYAWFIFDHAYERYHCERIKKIVPYFDELYNMLKAHKNNRKNPAVIGDMDQIVWREPDKEYEVICINFPSMIMDDNTFIYTKRSLPTLDKYWNEIFTCEFICKTAHPREVKRKIGDTKRVVKPSFWTYKRNGFHKTYSTFDSNHEMFNFDGIIEREKYGLGQAHEVYFALNELYRIYTLIKDGDVELKK